MERRIKCIYLEPTNETRIEPYACEKPGCMSCVRTLSLWKRSDNKELVTINEAPIGAMWWTTWYEKHDWICGPDGKSLMVRTPGGDWAVDSKASNCTKREDTKHKCWVRHGEPPVVTVDKNGNTCQAGAGSILQQGSGKYRTYHGFLRNGYLEEC